MDLVQKRKQLRQRQVEKVKKFRQSNMSASAAVEKQRDSDAAEKQKESAAKQKQREREDIKKEVRKEVEQEIQKESMDIENSDGTVFARVVDIIGPSNMKPMVSNGVWKGTDQIEEGSLHKWFKGSKSKDGKGGWVNVVTGGTCASDEPGEGTPKCVSSSKRASMTKAERLSASRRKKKADPGQQQKSGAAKPTYVSTDKKKMKEEITLDEKCWAGYTQKGMKKKGKKVVPNCVPVGEAKEEQGRSDYGKASVRNKRRFGKEGEPAIFDASGERGKMIDKRREDHKAKRGVKEDYYSGTGEKVVARTKKYMDKKGQKGAPGLDAMKSRTAEHKAKRGVKEEVLDELKSTTLLSYSNKAANELAFKGDGSKKAQKRATGVKRAAGQLTMKAINNEEVVTEADKKGKGSGKKDACYHKVKASAKVWPSAYASGRLVQCRKKGAANYGKSKSESYSWRDELDYVKEGAAWTKKAGKNKEGGLNEKGRKSYERENPGSDLKRPQPEGGSRKKSFCARMGGMKKKLTSSKTANDPDSRINKALRKWKC